MRAAFEIAGHRIKPGRRALVGLEMPRLSSHTALTMPVHVIHGRRDGPTLFVCAAIHGDELNGVEIIRQVLKTRALNQLRGTLIAVPVVNAYGLIQESRYLPDRRDLNRSFPGSVQGSLAARLANLFLEEIVSRCTHGIDLHTGAIHRSNLPQIRGDLDDPETLHLARAFGVPVLLNSSLRDGSLRAAARERGIPTLLYEGGEALRFDEVSIRAGRRGVLNVMRALGMLPPSRRKTRRPEPFISRYSIWARAPESGMLDTVVRLGAHVKQGDPLGHIDDPYSGRRKTIVSSSDGVVIGRLERPLVHEGDAVYHIARFKGDMSEIAGTVENFQADHANGERPQD